MTEQKRCPQCGERADHYVPSVGHLTPPEDAIKPYYTCEREARG